MVVEKKTWRFNMPAFLMACFLYAILIVACIPFARHWISSDARQISAPTTDNSTPTPSASPDLPSTGIEQQVDTSIFPWWLLVLSLGFVAMVLFVWKSSYIVLTPQKLTEKAQKNLKDLHLHNAVHDKKIQGTREKIIKDSSAAMYRTALFFQQQKEHHSDPLTRSLPIKNKKQETKVETSSTSMRLVSSEEAIKQGKILNTEKKQSSKTAYPKTQRMAPPRISPVSDDDFTSDALVLTNEPVDAPSQYKEPSINNGSGSTQQIITPGKTQKKNRPPKRPIQSSQNDSYNQKITGLNTQKSGKIIATEVRVSSDVQHYDDEGEYIKRTK
ncbi:MAG: hypothetical protein J6M18_04805 [Actinomycetaceae bacterium]|nr:hypothetical protein [Actinomycetaceae bacterium]